MSVKRVLITVAAGLLLVLVAFNLGRKAGAKQALAPKAGPAAASTAGGPAAAGAPVVFPENWIPDAAVAMLEISRPDSVLDLISDAALLKQFKGDGGGVKRFFDRGMPQQLRGFVKLLERQFNADGPTLLRRLFHGGVMIGTGGEKIFIAVVEADDAAFLQQLNDTIVNTIRRVTAGGAADRVSQEMHGDVACWTLSGGSAYHAVVDKYLVLSNNLPALKLVLDLKASGGPSLADNAEFQAAKKRAGGDAAATLFVSPALLQNLPKPGQGKNLQGNPLAVLMLAAYGDALRGSGWTALKADVRGRGLSFRLDGEAAPPRGSPGSFAWPEKAGDGVLPNITVPRQIAGLSVYRDLHGFYAAKDSLFPERTSQLIFFENMMGIYFSGRDITEDVMGSVGPHIRLVAAEQAYDPKIGTPSMKVPGIALVFEMRDKARYGVVAEEAWQKMLGMVNFTRGQKAQPGLIIDRVEHGGVRYTCAAFSHAEERDRSNLDSRFNFRPSIACVGDLLIFSTTDQLVNDIIDSVRGADAKPVAGINSLVEIDGARLGSILEANRDSMIRQNMVKKGLERAAAEKEFANGMHIVRTLGRATLRAGAPQGKVSAELAFDLGQPAAKPSVSVQPPVSGQQAMIETPAAAK